MERVYKAGSHYIVTATNYDVAWDTEIRVASEKTVNQMKSSYTFSIFDEDGDIFWRGTTYKSEDSALRFAKRKLKVAESEFIDELPDRRSGAKFVKNYIHKSSGEPDLSFIFEVRFIGDCKPAIFKLFDTEDDAFDVFDRFSLRKTGRNGYKKVSRREWNGDLGRYVDSFIYDEGCCHA